MKQKNFLIIVFIILSLFLLNSFGLFEGVLPASIVSVSNIDFAETQNVWVANAVINQSNEVIAFNYNYLNNPMTDTLSDGGKLTARSRIDVAFTQGQPTCKYDLTAINKSINIYGFPIQTYTYFQLNQFERDYPFEINVYKYPFSGGRQLLETRNISFSDGTTVLLANGDIKLNNLGALSGVTDCPSPAGTFLVPKIDSSGNTIGYAFATESSVSNQINQINSAIIEATNPFTITNGIQRLFSLLLNPQILQASQFYGFNDYFVEGSQAIVKMPYTSGYANITLEASNNLFDSITYYPPNPQPQITNLVLDKTSIDQTETTKLRVTVKNTGTQGSIDLIPYNETGIVSFNPPSDKIVLEQNESTTYQFDVYGASHGGDTVCIKAIGNQSGAMDTSCLGIIVFDNVNVADPDPRVIDPPIPGYISCGNGVCDVTESFYTCPSDCPLLPPSNGGSTITPEERCNLIPSDGMLVLGHVPSYNLLGQFTGCSPNYNLIGVVLIAGIFIVLILIGLFIIRGFFK